ncbi:MAG: hypothetical protein KF832_16630 [Caldilineaceae bacterium]|nr:hypothetical protein [Caldilineaceae bacterium]
MPILATKLYRPSPPAAAVDRPWLCTKLNDGLAGKLTLLVAPAGFGKSTLLSQWLPTLDRPATWLTLDRYDNDPIRFLRYVVAAWQQIDPACGTQALALLSAPQPPPLETILTTLLSELALIIHPFVFILDDYHLIEAAAVHQALNFLVAYLPWPAHVVIACRREPPLALARLRVDDQVTELPAELFRFSPTESATFFAAALPGDLPADLLAALTARTAGWAAGLRLAALILQSPPAATQADRATAFLTALPSATQPVFAYLAEEVFDGLPAAQQQFLLQTAFLPQLTGPLCDAVTAQPGSQSQLEVLAHDHLFLLPLDNQCQWYHYHPLFADFLRHRLQQQAADQIRPLQDRAARWYADHDLPEAALEQALAVANHELTAKIVEQHVFRLARGNALSPIADALQSLPKELCQRRPLLAFAHAGIALLQSRFEQARHWIGVTEQAVATLAEPDALPLPRATFQGYLDALRSTTMVNLREDRPTIVLLSQRALGTLPLDETFLRGAVALNLGDAYNALQEYTLAEQALATAVALGQQSGNLILHLAALGSQGGLHQHQGDLAQAAAIYQTAIQVGQAWGQATGQIHPATGKALAFYASILYEWNRLDEAERQATTAIAGCQQWGHAQHLIDSYYQLFKTQVAQGKEAAAVTTLTAARLVATTALQRSQQQGSPANAAHEMLTLVDRMQLRLWWEQGRLAAIEQWLATQSLDPSAWMVTRTRLALAQEQRAATFHWLARIEQQLAQRPAPLEQVQWLLLRSLAEARYADQAQALTTLRAAVTLAEASNYVRTFLDAGPMIGILLQSLARPMDQHAYRQRLLAAFATAGPVSAIAAPPASAEALSEREVEVLRLLAADLTYAAIGESLLISLNTVRTHAKNIYGKLGVNRRNQAIARAHTLGLL